MEKFEKSRLVLGAGKLWKSATEAKFLDGVGDGTLPEEAFRRWLVQDYLFVLGFTDFVALVASKTPRPGQKVVIDGLTALNEELDWFEEHAQSRNIDLGVEPQPIPVGGVGVDRLRGALVLVDEDLRWAVVADQLVDLADLPHPGQSPA